MAGGTRSDGVRMVRMERVELTKRAVGSVAVVPGDKGHGCHWERQGNGKQFEAVRASCRELRGECEGKSPPPLAKGVFIQGGP